jgi:hypothetical protein
MSAHLTRRMRCAVYTRKSTEEGLDQEYNSIDAQRDAGHAYIASQRAEGWIPLHDDPAYSGGTMDRPALQRLLADIEAGKVDTVVVYKIDRLTRSYLMKTKSLEAALPWLHLKGVSTGEMGEALEALVGPEAKGLSGKYGVASEAALGGRIRHLVPCKAGYRPMGVCLGRWRLQWPEGRAGEAVRAGGDRRE